MNKPLAAMAVAMLALLIVPVAATAQDEPTVTVEPTEVEAAGPADLTIEGAGFTPGLDLFILPCVAPDGDLTAINGQEDCDVGDLTPVTVGDDGTFSVEVNYDIVENFAVVAGDAAQSESAGALVAIAAGAGDATTTTMAVGDDSEATDEADDSTDGELPNTGAGSDLLIGGALALAAAGVLAARGGVLLGRR